MESNFGLVSIHGEIFGGIMEVLKLFEGVTFAILKVIP
jgi:hypothetical protein